MPPPGAADRLPFLSFAAMSRDGSNVRGGGSGREMRAHIPISLALVAVSAACWRIGEPTESEAVVSWAAYPDTVVAGELFSFEFAGPVSPNACGRLDTAIVRVTDEEIRLSARRSVYDTMCSDSPVSFYEARPMSIDAPGTYVIRTSGGLELGSITAVDSGAFARMRTTGEGTVTQAGGCLLFGPGWVGNQRPFALRGAPDEVRAETDSNRRIHVTGTLGGFTLCGAFGSRPVIEVESARITTARSEDYYDRAVNSAQ